MKLPGEQKQRLTLVRALYFDPPVLIFDEATSSLDANSERKVQGAIETLRGKRTVIIVAHRLATLAKADYIYVMNNGKVAESGSYNELCEKPSGIFAKMIKTQSVVG